VRKAGVDGLRLHDYVARWAASRPHTFAAIERGRRVTYAALSDAVDECARAMLAAGFERGDRVAMLAVPGVDFLTVFLATAAIGGIWVGLNPRYSDAELSSVVERVTPRLVFANLAIEQRSYAEWLRRLSGATTTVSLGGSVDGAPHLMSKIAFLACGAGLPPDELKRRYLETNPSDPCLIVFTSGSTGTPKGALISHAALVGASEVQWRVWRTEPLRILNNLPINHIGCVGDLTCYALIAGGTVVFSPRFDPADSVALIRDEQITVWAQVPTMFQLTLDSPHFDVAALRSLRLIFWGGAHASAELIERLAKLGTRLATSYGQTETVGSVAFTPEDARLELLAGTVGRAVPPYEIRIATSSGATAPPGESGEIEVRTPFGMSGYWGDPQATRGMLAREGWHRTGDVGALSAAGTLRLLGRVHDVFKSGGYNIYPQEIEAALQAHPDIRQVAVVGVPDRLYGQVAVAFVAVQKESVPPSDDALRGHLRARVANYKVPKRFIFVRELPRLAVGKVDRQALRELANGP